MTCLSGDSSGISPWEKYFGRKIDYKKNLKASFGDYVQASRNKVDNTMTTRTDGAIALYDTGNFEGTWWLYNLSTDKLIRRNVFKVMPMPDLVIHHLNNLRDRELTDNIDIEVEIDRNDIHVDIDDIDEDLNLREFINNISYNYIRVNNNNDGYEHTVDLTDEGVDNMNINNVDDNINIGDGTMRDDIINDREDTDNNNDAITVSDHEEVYDDFDFNFDESTGNLVDNIPIVNQDVESYDPEEHKANELNSQEQGSIIEDITIEAIEEPTIPSRYSLRPNRAKKGKYEKKREYGLHLTVKQAIDKLGDESIKSISKEKKQLVDLETFHGVNIQDISYDQNKKIIPSSMFLKKKYRADGTFEKLKARLVAGGHRQDKTIYEGKTSSPTVNTSSVFIIAAIAAMEGKAVATVDVPGAYLRAEMPKDGERVYMRLDKFISNILINIDTNYKRYLCDNNTIIVQLDKALYGCVQSALLWYNELKGILNNLGYNANPYDICVFNRLEEDNSQTTITIHVDDLLIIAGNEKILDRVINELNNIFKDLSITRGNKHNYLGMVSNVDKLNKSKNIETTNYINEIITLTGRL